MNLLKMTLWALLAIFLACYTRAIWSISFTSALTPIATVTFGEAIFGIAVRGLAGWTWPLLLVYAVGLSHILYHRVAVQEMSLSRLDSFVFVASVMLVLITLLSWLRARIPWTVQNVFMTR